MVVWDCLSFKNIWIFERYSKVCDKFSIKETRRAIQSVECYCLDRIIGIGAACKSGLEYALEDETG